MDYADGVNLNDVLDFSRILIQGRENTKNKLTGTYLQNDIKGADLNDTITGGQRDDNLYGNGGADVIKGLDGWDEIYAGKGNDTIYAGSGTNGLHYKKGDGNDTIYMDPNGTDNIIFDYDTESAKQITKDDIVMPDNTNYGVLNRPSYDDCVRILMSVIQKVMSTQ